MREFRPYGSVRGALSNERPYRDTSMYNNKIVVIVVLISVIAIYSYVRFNEQLDSATIGVLAFIGSTQVVGGENVE